MIRPFSSHRAAEIVSAPKVYGFDTGFVCYHRGWSALRVEDLGILWEHVVLNEMMAHTQSRQIAYWRDKRIHEVDFILAPKRLAPIAIECKWTAAGFDPTSLRTFRFYYPRGANYVVAQDVARPFSRTYGQMLVEFVGTKELCEALPSRAGQW